MTVPDITVWAQPLGGTWEPIGSGQSAAGIVVENDQWVSDGWGSKSATFDLRRKPGIVWPDLVPFTPIFAEIAGQPVWAGETRGTPSRDADDLVMSVQCAGLQDQLDDLAIPSFYLHQRLTDWKDVRSFLSAPLTSWKQNGRVEVGNGAIVIGFPNGAAVTLADSVGVVLDLGPDTTGASLSIDVNNEGFAAGSYQLYVKSGVTPATIITAGSNDLVVDPASATATSVNFAARSRYVAVFLYRTAGAATETTDRLVRITGLRVYRETAYRSGNASALLASQVLSDAVTRGTTTLSEDRSRVTATTTAIPELAPAEPQTPRQLIDAVNAYHDWQAAIDVDGRPVFKPRATAPLWSVAPAENDMQDASENSAEDVNNEVLVIAQTPADERLVVRRTQAQQPGSELFERVLSSPTLNNPSFDAVTTAWAAGSSTITRDTGVFDTSPASGRWDNTGASDTLQTGDTLTGAMTGTFEKGRAYVLRFRWRTTTISSGLVAPPPLAVTFGNTNGVDIARAQVGPLENAGVWTDASITWTPEATTTSAQVRFTWAVNDSLPSAFRWSQYIRLDTFRISAIEVTHLDKRRRRRNKVLSVRARLASDGVAAAALGDAWLAAHRSTPFSGTDRFVGNGSLRDMKTGLPVSPHTLLMSLGDLIHYPDRLNPDTGAMGRDARIAQVTYTRATDTATVQLDNRQRTFDALLARLDALSPS